MQREAFLEQLRRWQQDAEVELWFADECGVEGDPRPRRRWSARGSRPTLPYLGEHIRANVIGAVCPANGESFTMIFEGVDTEVFQCWLDELAKAVSGGADKRRLLIVDNASWHKAKRLHWHHFEPHFLPGYSPDFNPIERLWLRLKADFFSGFIARSPQEFPDRLCLALNRFMDDPPTVASHGSVILKDFPKLDDARKWIFGEAQKERATPGAILDLKERAGTGIFEVSAAQLHESIGAIKELEKVGMTLADAVKFAIRHAKPPAGAVSLEDAIERALAEKRRSKRPAYLADLGKRWRRFERWLPPQKQKGINTITRLDI